MMSHSPAGEGLGVGLLPALRCNASKSFSHLPYTTDKKLNGKLVVIDVGTFNGQIMVFGGVYSNLPALERLMEIADELGIPAGNIICTGDIVGYCAEPEECVQRIRQWGVHAIAGNVEMQLRNREDDCGCNFNQGSRCDLFSRQWYPYAQARLSEASIQWMRTLPHHLRFAYGPARVCVLHGSCTDPSEFVFRSTPWARKQPDFEATQADVILAGHCGLPFHHAQDGLLWLNAGVIGMPANDGTPRVWYLTLDIQEEVFLYRHQSYVYDHESAASRMEQHRLPREYSETLRTGLWDNCEILPEEETGAMGREIVF